MLQSRKIVLLDGPPASGKTTVGRACATRFSGSGCLAVLEHDDMAVMAGVRGAHGETAGTVWEAALYALAASALAYLDGGMSVLAIVNYGRERRKLLERLLIPAPVRHVVLLPPWELNRAWAAEKWGAAMTPELPHIGWAAHKEFYEDLVAMSRDGLFAEEIDPAELSRDEIVDLLAKQLGLDDSATRPR